MTTGKRGGTQVTLEPIDDIRSLGFSSRVLNCLEAANIRTIGDLVKQRPRDLLWIKNLGRASVAEIQKVLSAHGLTLGDIWWTKLAGTGGNCGHGETYSVTTHIHWCTNCGAWCDDRLHTWILPLGQQQKKSL